MEKDTRMFISKIAGLDTRNMTNIGYYEKRFQTVNISHGVSSQLRGGCRCEPCKLRQPHYNTETLALCLCVYSLCIAYRVEKAQNYTVGGRKVEPRSTLLVLRTAFVTVYFSMSRPSSETAFLYPSRSPDLNKQ